MQVVEIEQRDCLTLEEQRERKINPGGQQMFKALVEVME